MSALPIANDAWCNCRSATDPSASSRECTGQGLFTLNDVMSGMDLEISAAQFRRIGPFLPMKRGNVAQLP